MYVYIYIYIYIYIYVKIWQKYHLNIRMFTISSKRIYLLDNTYICYNTLKANIASCLS